jgi:hypothetical protein
MATLRIVLMSITALTTLAFAGETEDKIDAALDTMLAEWTALVSCTALDPDMQAVLAQAWAESIAKTDAFLKEKGADAGLVKSVGERLSGLKPVVTEDAPASELIAYCHGQADWQRKLLNFDITKPEDAIRAVLGEAK